MTGTGAPGLAVLPEQAPGVVAVFGALAQMGREREPVLVGEFPGYPDDARTRGPVEVQAARVLITGEPERLDAEPEDLGRQEVKRFGAFGVPRVPGRAEDGLGDGDEAPGARREDAGRGPLPERLDRDERERREGHQDHRGEAPAGPEGGGPEGEPAEARPVLPGRGAPPRIGQALEARPRREERRQEERRARPEEGAGFGNRFRHAEPEQRQATCPGDDGPAPGARPGRTRGRQAGPAGEFPRGFPGQEAPRGTPHELPQGPPGGPQGHQDPGPSAGGHRRPTHGHAERGRALPGGIGGQGAGHRALPDAGEQADHPGGVGDSGERPGHRAHGGDRRGLEKQVSGDPARRPAAREQHADLPEPALHPQPVEERQQHERGHQQEVREVEEIEPEVRRSPRGLETLLADRHGHEAEVLGGEGRDERLREFRPVGSALPGSEADRGRASLTHRPEPPRHRKGHERLGQGPELLPVELVALPNAAQVHRERWVPVTHPGRVAHSREFGSQGLVREEGVSRDRRPGHERRRFGVKAALLLPDEKREIEPVPRVEPEILRQPGPRIQHVRAALPPALREQRRREPADERIGGLPIGGPDGSGQVGQHGGGAGSRPLGRGQRPFDHPVRQHQAAALEDESAFRRLAQAQAAVIEGTASGEDGRQRGGLFPEAAVPLPRGAKQQRVRPRDGTRSSTGARRVHHPAQVIQRQEHRAGGALLREEREIARAHPGRRVRPGRDLAPDGDAGIVLLAEEGCRGDLLVSPDPDQQPVAGNEAEAPETAADAGGSRLDDVFEPVEGEVAPVHPEDGRRDRPAVGRHHGARQAIDGRGGCEPFPEVGARAQPGREARLRIVREGVQREHRVVGGPEPFREGRAQAAPHRVPDDQRPDQHRNRDRGGGGDQEVFAEVVPEAAPGELGYPKGGGHAVTRR